MTTTAAPQSAARRTSAGILTGQAATAAAALAVNALAARVMGPAGRGEIAWYLQLSYILAVMALAGTDRVYPATAGHPDPGAALQHMRRLTTPGLAVTTAGCCITAVVLAATGHDQAWMVAVLAAVTAGNATLTAVRAAAAAATAPGVYLRVSVTGQLAMVAAAAALCTLGAASPLVWLSTYAVCLTAPTAAAWATTRRTPTQPPPATRRLGRAVLPGSIANIVAMRCDRLLLPLLAGYDQLGLYVVAATMTELITWPVQAYTDAHVPVWARTAQTGTLRPARILAAAAGYAAAAATAAAVTIRAVLVPVFGDEYRPALNLVWPLAAAAGMYGLSRVGVGLAIAAGRHRMVSTADITAMGVSVTAYALLIPGHGAMGAALGSLAGYGAAATVAVAAAATHRPRNR